MLMSSVANLGANKNEKDRMCDITVGDVLGPLIKQEEGVRDVNFSLLSYSFSLVRSHLEWLEQAHRR